MIMPIEKPPLSAYGITNFIALQCYFENEIHTVACILYYYCVMNYSLLNI